MTSLVNLDGAIITGGMVTGALHSGSDSVRQTPIIKTLTYQEYLDESLNLQNKERKLAEYKTRIPKTPTEQLQIQDLIDDMGKAVSGLKEKLKNIPIEPAPQTINPQNDIKPLILPNSLDQLGNQIQSSGILKPLLLFGGLIAATIVLK